MKANQAILFVGGIVLGLISYTFFGGWGVVVAFLIAIFVK